MSEQSHVVHRGGHAIPGSKELDQLEEQLGELQASLPALMKRTQCIEALESSLLLLERGLHLLEPDNYEGLRTLENSRRHLQKSIDTLNKGLKKGFHCELESL